MGKKDTTRTNGKAPGLQSGGSKKNTTNAKDYTGINPAQLELNLVSPKLKYSRKSTATEAQYERIDRAFDYVGKLISTLDFRKMGVLHPAGRIREMNREMGFYIPTVDLRTVID